LSKEGIVPHILEKQFIEELVAASKDQPTETTATRTHNFHLVNVIFCEEITQISHCVEVLLLEMSWIPIWSVLILLF
jgi:hypothetical protein